MAGIDIVGNACSLITAIEIPVAALIYQQHRLAADIGGFHFTCHIGHHIYLIVIQLFPERLRIVQFRFNCDIDHNITGFVQNTKGRIAAVAVEVVILLGQRPAVLFVVSHGKKCVFMNSQRGVGGVLRRGCGFFLSVCLFGYLWGIGGGVFSTAASCQTQQHKHCRQQRQKLIHMRFLLFMDV